MEGSSCVELLNPLVSKIISGTIDSASIGDDEINGVGVDDLVGNISVFSAAIVTSVVAAIEEMFCSQGDSRVAFSSFGTKHNQELEE